MNCAQAIHGYNVRGNGDCKAASTQLEPLSLDPGKYNKALADHCAAHGHGQRYPRLAVHARTCSLEMIGCPQVHETFACLGSSLAPTHGLLKMLLPWDAQAISRLMRDVCVEIELLNYQSVLRDVRADELQRDLPSLKRNEGQNAKRCQQNYRVGGYGIIVFRAHLVSLQQKLASAHPTKTGEHSTEQRVIQLSMMTSPSQPPCLEWKDQTSRALAAQVSPLRPLLHEGRLQIYAARNKPIAKGPAGKLVAIVCCQISDSPCHYLHFYFRSMLPGAKENEQARHLSCAKQGPCLSCEHSHLCSTSELRDGMAGS